MGIGFMSGQSKEGIGYGKFKGNIDVVGSGGVPINSICLIGSTYQTSNVPGISDGLLKTESAGEGRVRQEIDFFDNTSCYRFVSENGGTDKWIWTVPPLSNYVEYRYDYPYAGKDIECYIKKYLISFPHMGESISIPTSEKGFSLLDCLVSARATSSDKTFGKIFGMNVYSQNNNIIIENKTNDRTLDSAIGFIVVVYVKG